MEHRCKNCGDLSERPERVVEKAVREPCRCGLTEATRNVRWVVCGFISFFLMLLGCCAIEQHQLTEQVRALSDQYEVRALSDQYEVRAHDAMNSLDRAKFEVVPREKKKPEGPKQ